MPLALDRMGYARPKVEILANYLIGHRAFLMDLPFAESAQLYWHDLALAIHRTQARSILQRYRAKAYVKFPVVTISSPMYVSTHHPPTCNKS